MWILFSLFLFLSLFAALFIVFWALRHHRPVEPRKFLLVLGLLSFAFGFAESDLSIVCFLLGFGVSALIAWRAPYAFTGAHIPLPFIVCILSAVTMVEGAMINECIRVESLYASGVRVPAVISDVHSHSTIGLRPLYEWKTDTVTATYRDANQRQHSIAERTDITTYKVGDEVEVIYKQDNPDMGTIVMPMQDRDDTYSKGKLALFLLVVIIGWGVMFRLFKPKDTVEG
jgi:hypothetical protein